MRIVPSKRDLADDVCVDEEGNFYERGMLEDERTEFIASIKQARAESAAGLGIAADVVLAELCAKSR